MKLIFKETFFKLLIIKMIVKLTGKFVLLEVYSDYII